MMARRRYDRRCDDVDLYRCSDCTLLYPDELLSWRTVHRPYYIWSQKYNKWTEYVDKTEGICCHCDALRDPTKYSSGILRDARTEATEWKSSVTRYDRWAFGAVNDHAVDDHAVDDHAVDDHVVDDREHGADGHAVDDHDNFDDDPDDDDFDNPEYRPCNWIVIDCMNCNDDREYPRTVHRADNHRFCTHCGGELSVHSYASSDEDDGGANGAMNIRPTTDPNQNVTLRCKRCDEYYDDYYDYDYSPVAIATTTTITTTRTTLRWRLRLLRRLLRLLLRLVR